MLFIIPKLCKLAFFSSLVVGPSYPIISKLSNQNQIPNQREIKELKEKKFCPVIDRYKEESCEAIILDIY